MLIIKAEKRIERHHEASLRLGPAPIAGQRLELVAELRADLAGPCGGRGVSAALAALEPVHRLPHLPDRPSLEGERRCFDHRFVTVVERMEAVAAVKIERAFRDAENRNAPATRARKAQERADEVGKAFRRADRVT